MAETQALKYYFGSELAQLLGGKIQAVYPQFPVNRFVKMVAERVGELELKARVSVIAQVLRELLPDDYASAVRILCDSLGPEITENQGMFNDGYFLMPVAHFVEIYGLDDFEVSMKAIEEITKRHTGEYAIRPFLRKDFKRTMKVIRRWAIDSSLNVRRLASEGIRPRLPWATQIDELRKNPEAIMEVLEMLKDDPSAFVRKSVANCLNDIAKDHRELVLKKVSVWMKNPTESRAWVVRHALRNLVRAGNPDALELLGYRFETNLSVDKLRVVPLSPKLGTSVEFSFLLVNEESTAQQVVIDYVLHFPRANAKPNSKVFKLKAIEVGPHESVELKKRHALRHTKTRQLYPGKYRIDLQVSGRVLAGVDFQVNG